MDPGLQKPVERSQRRLAFHKKNYALFFVKTMHTAFNIRNGRVQHAIIYYYVTAVTEGEIVANIYNEHICITICLLARIIDNISYR